jgi:hypothetical protein
MVLSGITNTEREDLKDILFKQGFQLIWEASVQGWAAVATKKGLA